MSTKAEIIVKYFHFTCNHGIAVSNSTIHILKAVSQLQLYCPIVSGRFEMQNPKLQHFQQLHNTQIVIRRSDVSMYLSQNCIISVTAALLRSLNIRGRC